MGIWFVVISYRTPYLYILQFDYVVIFHTYKITHLEKKWIMYMELDFLFELDQKMPKLKP